MQISTSDLKLLNDNHWHLHRTCKCNGVYREYYRNRPLKGLEIVIFPYQSKFGEPFIGVKRFEKTVEKFKTYELQKVLDKWK